MKKVWRPSFFGKLFTRSKDWTVTIENADLVLSIGQQPLVHLKELQVTDGVVWARLEAKDNEDKGYVLKGIPHTKAMALKQELLIQKSCLAAAQ